MPYQLDQPILEKSPPYIVYRDRFDALECGKIIEIAKALGMQPAGVGVDRIDPKTRSSTISWLNWSSDADWVYAKLAAVVNDARQHWYPFHLSGFMEPVQLTHYRASDKGHYDWHQDLGAGPMSRRKLSVVCLLNKPVEFEGGELEMFSIPGNKKTVQEMSQGTAICFPSWEPHRVRKIKVGERWSLVSWVHGPPFV